MSIVPHTLTLTLIFCCFLITIPAQATQLDHLPSEIINHIITINNQRLDFTPYTSGEIMLRTSQAAIKVSFDPERMSGSLATISDARQTNLGMFRSLLLTNKRLSSIAQKSYRYAKDQQEDQVNARDFFIVILSKPDLFNFAPPKTAAVFEYHDIITFPFFRIKEKRTTRMETIAYVTFFKRGIDRNDSVYLSFFTGDGKILLPGQGQKKISHLTHHTLTLFQKHIPNAFVSVNLSGKPNSRTMPFSLLNINGLQTDGNDFSQVPTSLIRALWQKKKND